MAQISAYSLSAAAILAIILLQSIIFCATQDVTDSADCTAPLVTGNCRAAFRRWGSRDGKCKEFIYGGCGGNSNNFRSEAACEAACPSTALASQCDQPLEAGPCEAAFTKWGYRNGKCRKFIYGGCEGNDNQFSSKKACQKSCDRGAVKPRKCKQSMKKGSPCAFGTIRWLYNKRTNTCEQTAEKMCSQTGDNKFGFSSQSQCERKCVD